MRDEPLRSFGVLPGNAVAPAVVRSRLKGGQVFFQWFMSVLMIGGFAGIGVALVVVGIRVGDLNGIGMGLFSVLFFSMIPFFLYHNSDTKVWVELDGDVLRARNLYTGRITERTVDEIEEVATQVYLARGGLALKLAEAMQGRVRGFTFRFPDDKVGIRIFRPEMTNVRELVEAVVDRMARHAPVTAEVMDFEGKPMVRRVTWTDRAGTG